MDSNILNESLYDWLHKFKGNNDVYFRIEYIDENKHKTCSKLIKGGDLLLETLNEIPFENVMRIERIY